MEDPEAILLCEINTAKCPIAINSRVVGNSYLMDCFAQVSLRHDADRLLGF